MMQAGYDVLRSGAAMIDLPGRGRIVLTGADRVTFLHAILTNDILSLRPGSGCYAAYLTPQGRMISDMVVLALEDQVVLDVPLETTRRVAQAFDRIIFTEDVKVLEVTESLEAFGLFGPRAVRVLADVSAVSPSDVAHLPSHHTVQVRVSGAPLILARADEQLGPGFTISADRTAVHAVRARLASVGAIEVDPLVLEVRRIEAGLPRFGADMAEHTIPLEAGIEQRAISLTKGCYPGQEVIIRVLHRGHGRVAKKLVGLSVQGDSVPARGDRVIADGREPGSVTSATFSPALDIPIALAYVPRESANPGTAVAIEHGEVRLAATVTSLPFVDFTASGR